MDTPPSSFPSSHQRMAAKTVRHRISGFHQKTIKRASTYGILGHSQTFVATGDPTGSSPGYIVPAVKPVVALHVEQNTHFALSTCIANVSCTPMVKGKSKFSASSIIQFAHTEQIDGISVCALVHALIKSKVETVPANHRDMPQTTRNPKATKCTTTKPP
jgi:hypothetical protein